MLLAQELIPNYQYTAGYTDAEEKLGAVALSECSTVFSDAKNSFSNRPHHNKAQSKRQDPKPQHHTC